MNTRFKRIFVWIAAAAALTAAAVVTVVWLRPAPEQRLAAPAPVPTPAGPPAFEHWLRFESADAQKQAQLGDAFVDSILQHQVFQIPPAGLPPMRAQALLLEDDELLFSSGRRLWTRELTHQPGLVGKFCYVHSRFCLGRLFEVQFFIDGHPAVIYADQYAIQRAPSHTLVRYRLGPGCPPRGVGAVPDDASGGRARELPAARPGILPGNSAVPLPRRARVHAGGYRRRTPAP
jgi:hypothetical protein